MNHMTFTHKVSFYGVHCYLDIENGYISGTNWLTDKLIPVMCHLHNFVAMCFPGFGEDGFPMKIVEEYNRVYKTGLPTET